MNRKLIVAGALALTLTACGGTTSKVADSTEDNVATDAPELPTQTTESTPPPPPEPEVETNDRGNLVLSVGEEAVMEDMTLDKEIVTLAVDGIAPANCGQDWHDYGSPPENGHLIAVDLRASTAPEYAQSELAGWFSINPNDWKFVGADGITRTDLATISTYSCLGDSEQFTSDSLTPGSQYAGKVVLDVPDTHGTLIYLPSMMSDGGWEWTF